MEGDGMPFPSIFVSPTRVFITTCHNAALIFDDHSFEARTHLPRVRFKNGFEEQLQLLFIDMERDGMSIPSIFVSPTRVFKTTCNATTATVTPTSIALTLEFTFLGSLFKRELQNTWTPPFQTVGKRQNANSLYYRLTNARFKNLVPCRHGDTDDHSCNAIIHLPRIPFQKGTGKHLHITLPNSWKEVECQLLVLSSFRREF